MIPLLLCLTSAIGSNYIMLDMLTFLLSNNVFSSQFVRKEAHRNNSRMLVSLIERPRRPTLRPTQTDDDDVSCGEATLGPWYVGLLEANNTKNGRQPARRCILTPCGAYSCNADQGTSFMRSPLRRKVDR